MESERIIESLQMTNPVGPRRQRSRLRRDDRGLRDPSRRDSLVVAKIRRNTSWPGPRSRAPNINAMGDAMQAIPPMRNGRRWSRFRLRSRWNSRGGAETPSSDPLPTFRTPRLTLRPRCLADLDACLAMDRDGEVTRFVAGPWSDPIAHRAFVADRIRRCYPPGMGYWTILAPAFIG
jgi:hypothetical protein